MTYAVDITGTVNRRFDNGEAAYSIQSCVVEQRRHQAHQSFLLLCLLYMNSAENKLLAYSVVSFFPCSFYNGKKANTSRLILASALCYCYFSQALRFII